ncbi:hypothetical protein DQ384_04090 [Sphaerisporangium album]|uniref:Uncharacterized protein n=1 Tax=Sphaerisporangium album TaxID=509200 RepID=A0A367FQL3_9ACTN|nr:hypothetical protein [Sphaerisporangium album]RCG32673.1 hypothetical protein DQ384_04090 [Sphaerisporangium album]
MQARLVIPVIDGVDEMDPQDALGYDSRAGRPLRALNAYQDGRSKAAVVLTCRTDQYRSLERHTCGPPPSPGCGFVGE